MGYLFKKSSTSCNLLRTAPCILEKISIEPCKKQSIGSKSDLHRLHRLPNLSIPSNASICCHYFSQGSRPFEQSYLCLEKKKKKEQSYFQHQNLLNPCRNRHQTVIMVQSPWPLVTSWGSGTSEYNSLKKEFTPFPAPSNENTTPWEIGGMI